LTIVPSRDNVLQTLSPTGVSGTFTAILGASVLRNLPSASIVSKSVDATSALTGPSTMSQILDQIDELPAGFGDKRRVGRHPIQQSGFGEIAISAISAVSTKNFMAYLISKRIGRDSRARARFP